MFFVDSSFLISLFSEKDENHGRAKDLYERLDAEGGVISDHVLDEVVTFISRRAGGRKAASFGSGLLASRQIRLVFASDDSIAQALLLVEKHGFSLCDGLSVSLMRQIGLSKVLSFDSDFDKIPGVSRIR